MNKLISGRLAYISISVLLLIISALIVTKVFNESIVFFYSPSEVLTVQPRDKFRLGGVVKEESIKVVAANTYEFVITDFAKEITIKYTGVLPTLFKEGQGAIAFGQMDGDKFSAEEILAKHDENYMPKEVADSLKKNGFWKNSSN